MRMRCDTDAYEGCKCNRTPGHPNPHRCEHGVQWAVRPDGRFFVIYEDHAPGAEPTPSPLARDEDRLRDSVSGGEA